MDLSFLDGLDECAYVSDPDTYDIIYINKLLLTQMGLTEMPPAGSKCYKAFQNLDTPCPFCNNSRLKEGEYINWVHHNLLLGGDFQVRDTLIDYQGRKVRLELCFRLEDQNLGAPAAEELMPILTYASDLLGCSFENYRRVVSGILEDIGRRFGAQYCFICEDIVGRQLVITHLWTAEGARPIATSAVVSDSFAAELAFFKDHDCLLISNPDSIKETMPNLYELLDQARLHSFFILPLRFNDSVIGFFGLANLKDPLRARASLAPLTSVGSFFSAAIVRLTRDYDSNCTRRSSTDQQIFSRRKLTADLELFERVPVGCIVADINGLKQINDEGGHELGDQIIDRCITVLRELLPFERIYRIGDDEFAVLVLNNTRKAFENKLFSVRKALSGPHGFVAAVGAKYDPAGFNAGDTLTQAETRMFKDKSRFYLISPKLGGMKQSQRYLRTLVRPSAVQDLLAARAFYPVFQPIFNGGTRKVVCAEVLCRLHLNGQPVAPVEFIPLLESVNLAYLVDYFILECACAQLRRWLDQGRWLCPLAVNFSRHTVLQTDFIEHITAIIQRFEISPQLLHLEITESVSERDRDSLIGTAQEAKKRGFLLSVDDFGVDYANLITIADLPMDAVKYDMRIIGSLKDNAKMQLIFKSFQHMCDKLKVETIAEGVESEEQVKLLLSLGCTNMQGFYFSRPLTQEQFDQLLTTAAAGGV